MVFFDRHISNVISRLAKRKPVLIITGARQVGKSTNLKHELLGHGVSYITLDSPLLREVAKESPTAFLLENKSPIIIDEIQKSPNLFEHIKIAVDENDVTGQYYLSGSHSFNLLKGVTESLAGRAGIIKMLGLSKREINQIPYFEPFLPTKQHLDNMNEFNIPYDYDLIIRQIHKGSFPELYKTESDLLDWTDYYTSYLQTYLEKDVRDLINIGNVSTFIKFMRAVASLSGQQLNYATLGEICMTSTATIKSWLSILETSGLIYMLEPYSNNYNKRLIKTPKLYLLDIGLLCFLSGWNTPQQMVNGAKWGHIFESYVVSEVLKSYYNNGIVYPPLYYYRDKDKNEIDLIIEQGNALYPIEIKTTTDPVKSMTATFSILKKINGKTVDEGAIICLTNRAQPFANNTWLIPIDRI